MAQMDPDVETAKELNALMEQIIGCAFKVGSALGPGYLEKVYENALAHELRKAGLRVEQQQRITVRYDGVVVGEYVSDAIVGERVLLELKAIRSLDNSHVAQCLNCLTATGLPIGLVLNFGTKVEVRRVVSSSAPRFPLHLGASGAPTPMTWAERAEFGDDNHGQ